MISGTVTHDGVPVIMIELTGRTWSAIIDTGFNGDLQLPVSLRDPLGARFVGRLRSLLASGLSVEEDVYLVPFPFDEVTVQAEATFVSESEILIGTKLLSKHRLEIDFRAQTVLLERT